MSVAFTEQAVRARTKTVTRRKGWLFLKRGDRLTLCRKVMGRKPGEPLVRICDVEVVSALREPLRLAGPAEMVREGLPGITFDTFWRTYFAPQGIGPDDEVTRIEWRYLDEWAASEVAG